LMAAVEQGCETVVIIGSDIPDITTDIMLKAFAALKENDLVLGPADDGGYYLIGMRKLIKEVFKNVPWSSDITLEVSMNNAKQAGYSVGLIKILSDIDTLEDAKKHGLI